MIRIYSKKQNLVPLLLNVKGSVRFTEYTTTLEPVPTLRKSNSTVVKLGIENIGARLFFCTFLLLQWCRYGATCEN